MTKRINIVFDGPPSHDSGRFVEVEDENGRSIKAGEWVEREDGFWELQISHHEDAPLTLRDRAAIAIIPAMVEEVGALSMAQIQHRGFDDWEDAVVADCYRFADKFMAARCRVEKE